MKSLANFPADKSLSMEEIVKQGGYYSEDGVWNNITEIDGKLYRGRVEVFVIDQDQNIFMQITGKKKYRLPGGSFEKDEDHRIQAYNEVLEEARIICENVTYTGVHYIKTFDKKIDKKPGMVTWDGTYNEVYVADYVDQYTGYIHPMNRDKTMYKEGKWYKYRDVENMLSKEHKEALGSVLPEAEIGNILKKDEFTPEQLDEFEEKIMKMREDMESKNPSTSFFSESAIETEDKFAAMFSPEEMHELGVMNEGHNLYCENVPIDKFTKDWFEKYEKEPNTAVDSAWYNQLRNLYIQYVSNPSNVLKQQILNLGWNPEVPVNYDNVTKAAELAEKKNTSEESIKIDENFIFSKKDNVYNFDKWDSGESNILIITGLSGSGKSTLAFALADEYDATVVQLDHLQCYERFRAGGRKTKGTELVNKFINKHKELKDYDFSSITYSSFKPVFDEFFPWLLKELGKDKKNRYIIEGIHIILFTKYSDIKKYPLICINTPMYKSIIRHWIRDQFSISELVKHGLDDIRLFKTWEDSYKAFYNSIGESSIENRDIMIFDLGSVLIDGDFKQALLNDVRIPNVLVDELINAWLIKEDSSFTELCTKKEYIDKVYKNTPIHYHRYIPTVAEISISYLRPCDWTQSIISIFRNKGYEIYYLSNWSKWSVNEIKKTTETMDFLDDLDGGAFSYETGYLKPDKRIYEFFLKKYNIDPNRAVFFDDKKENIEAAEKLGIKGVLFSKDKGNEILAEFIEGEEDL